MPNITHVKYAILTMLCLSVSACDDGSAKFVEECKKKEKNVDCTCAFDLAKSRLDDEHLDVFVDAYVASSAREADRAIAKLGLLDQAEFAVRMAELGISIERACGK